MTLQNRTRANQQAVEQMAQVRPQLIGISSAAEAMGLDRATILTSGPALPFAQYSGGQRSAIIGGALYEGLAADEASAIAAFESGDIRVRGCQEFDCVGSLAGVTTASMPVLVVADEKTGNRAYCTLYEGDSSDRLNYGSYTEKTRANLENLRLRVAPVLDQLAKRQNEGVDLRSIMARALTMGDDLHSRNTAATLLLFRTLISGAGSSVNADAALDVLKDDYFFLRLSMAASKLMANAMRNIEHSTIVTGMAFSCKEFGVQVSGLGDTWFRGPVPTFEDYRVEPGFTIDDMEIMGGESIVTEVVGLGGMAQAAAFPLQRSSGGTADRMTARTEAMYGITFTESTDFLIPSLDYRGVPLGIDLEKVVATKRTPYLNIGMAGTTKRQIGGGVAVAPLEPFIEAWKEFEAL